LTPFLFQPKIKIQGYLKALFDNGIGANRKILKDGKGDIETAYHKMNEILESREKVTAVFAASDKMAIGAMRAIRDNGLDAPGDISVAAHLRPLLRTVSYRGEELGRPAVWMLLDNIRHQNKNNERLVKLVYRCAIKQRQSVKNLARAHTEGSVDTPTRNEVR